MSSFTKLPQSLAELKRLPFADRQRLWAKYSPHPFRRQNTALWYYMQCDRLKLRILPKHMIKIRKYMNNPDACLAHVYRNKYNLESGTVITKIFRGKQHIITVGDNNVFAYNGKSYHSLSGIAREITGIKISGPDFFGLTPGNKNANK